MTRNSFPGPRYRDVDLNLGKAFGLPKMRVIGEGATIEVKANFLNVFNLLNIDPSTVSKDIAGSNLGHGYWCVGSSNY